MAEAYRSLYSVIPARVRDDDAFDIFNDISAAGNHDLCWYRRQVFSGNRSRISDCDGLGATQCHAGVGMKDLENAFVA